MQPQEQNQYEFILDPSQQGGGGSSGGPAFLQDPVKRLVAAGAFVVIVLIVVLIGVSVLFSGGGGSSDLEDVAGYQSEFVRIGTDALLETRDPAVRAQVSTLLTFMKSDLAAITAYTGSFDEKKAALYYRPEIDETLERASERSTYDEAIIEVFAELSVEYKSALQLSLENSSSEPIIKVLETAASNILTYEE